MSLTERLTERLRALGHPVEDGSVLSRTYAGRAMRTNGAWSWTLRPPGGRGMTYGSQWPASTVIRCQHWDVGPDLYGATDERSIDPCRPCAGVARR